MAVTSSGEIKFSDLAAEFGDTPPYQFSEFYRGAGKVPDVNDNVPASGQLRLGQFYGSVNELLQAVTANASINAQTIFGSDWGTNIPKRLSIPAGVTIGPLTIPTGMGGTLEVDVAGEIQGLGGSAGSAGGNAITASTSFTLNVLSGGAVRGGGGGGGTGGAGGNGRVASSGSSSAYQFGVHYIYRGAARWAGDNPASSVNGYTGHSAYGPIEYVNDHPSYGITVYYTTYSSRTGGTGGAGGVGIGYGQSLTSGSAGTAGGTNAGAGGSGGSGGDWGTAGSTGATGVNGNVTNGSAGSAGGAAGAAVLMNAGTVTVNNSGTINGAY